MPTDAATLETLQPGIALLRLTRAARLNALSLPDLQFLHGLLDTCLSDASQRVLVIIGDAVYQPVPLTGDGDYTVTQKAIGAENKIHVTAESIQMSSANCDNQDCVDQGEVSLSNREERLLGNMIICLPNNVTLELLTPAEAEELIAQANAQQ